MSSVNTAVQLITREEAEKGLSAAGSTCSPALAKGPWEYDLAEALAGAPAYGPGASSSDVAPKETPRQGQLPDEYKRATDAELDARIRAAKKTLGDRAVILGHFYQRDEVIQYADFVGDSFQLANAALTKPDAEAIIFCGVHFMAETADILSTPEQAVILPNLAAGCSMADMADEDSVEECWEQLEEIFGTDTDAQGRVPVIPVTYMNSSAALKAFCGRNGGIVCTSSNAKVVLEWAFERGQRVLFFPDQHLGRNTAKALGVPLEQMPMWNPRKELGGNDEQTLLDARVILWHGFCSVHKRFNVGQIEKAPRRFPRRERNRAPRVPHGGRGCRGLRRFHRLHQEGHRCRHRTHHVRHRYGNQHGEPARCGKPTAHDLLPGPRDLPLLHHVPHPPRLPRMGAGGTRRRTHRQPHHRG
ncbi:hypothetical protein StoSoilB13_12510 [Arthrobacter sp. StoSoilB13]|nr:hypothetical protein StoSoilB13_12510 [Arthrobacter sp. StoSoilB13]